MNQYLITSVDRSQNEFSKFVIARDETTAQKVHQLYFSDREIISIDLVRRDVPTQNAHEREILTSIMQIAKELGPQSCLTETFRECFELAEENIENNFAIGLPDQLAAAEEKMSGIVKQLAEVQTLQKRISALEQALEKEQEWVPYESKHNVSQSAYMELAAFDGTEKLTDDKATAMVAHALGFDPEKVTILHGVNQEEINRHHRVRKVGEIERLPLYCSSDWNYIRFDCAGRCYEFHDGELKPFYC